MFKSKKVLLKGVWLFFIWLVTSHLGFAQSLEDVKTADTPLALKSLGSFYVGGKVVKQTEEELGDFGPAGNITVDQMYVQFMVPVSEQEKIPVIMIHGMALTGKCWETTPDGRMGWNEYFVRNGFPTYVPDQVSRGRSGYNQAIFNQIRTGQISANETPKLRRFADEVIWPNFRIGYEINAPFPYEQFPINALGELSKQGVPDLALGDVGINEENYQALASLSKQLEGAVIISHSQSGHFPFESALLDPKSIKGIIAIEPGNISARYSKEQIEIFTKVPILFVYGDFLEEVPTGIPNFSWQTTYDNCLPLIEEINAAGGNATMLFLPDKGIRGNSHMPMQDLNNLEIADLIIDWMSRNVN